MMDRGSRGRSGPVTEHSPSDSSDSSSSSESEREWREGGEEEEEEDEDEQAPAVVSLLDDRVFPDAAAMLAHCREAHAFDFQALRARLALDFYGSVKLINLIRQRVRDGTAVSAAEINQADLADDGLLKPVLADDALILCLDDLPEPDTAAAAAQDSKDGSPANGAGAAAVAAAQDAPGSPSLVEDLRRRNAELEAELERLSQQFAEHRLFVAQTLDRRWGVDDVEGNAKEKQHKGDVSAAAAAKEVAKKPGDSEGYFEGYAQNDIHETMLKDAVRTDAYRDFIYDNKDLFAGKVVLDIGCGTGILSMFCARAGAARVIAVDRSDILDKARENVLRNWLGDVVTCVKGRIEDVDLRAMAGGGVDSVDVIVSEWMGYACLFEAMLPSVLYARDRYLAPGGLVVPSHAALWVAPVSDPDYVADHVAFWRDVYGFDMRAMLLGVCDDVRVQAMPAASLCGSATPAGPFLWLDLHTCKAEDLVFTAPWTCVDTRAPNGTSKPQDGPDGEGVEKQGDDEDKDDVEQIDGFLIWFDMFFSRSRDDPTLAPPVTAKEWAARADNRVAFTTGPHGLETHWKQSLLLVNEKNRARSQGRTRTRSGSRGLAGEITYSIPDNHSRGLNIAMTWGTEGDGPGERLAQTWVLS